MEILAKVHPDDRLQIPQRHGKLDPRLLGSDLRDYLKEEGIVLDDPYKAKVPSIGRAARNPCDERTLGGPYYPVGYEPKPAWIVQTPTGRVNCWGPDNCTEEGFPYAVFPVVTWLAKLIAPSGCL